jgi:hypothetical protein
VLLAADPQEAAKGHDGVHHPPPYLLNDQVVDRADVLAVRAVDQGALDPIALDQGMR